jgi:tetratricopeptide (TPR) repeat protein
MLAHLHPLSRVLTAALLGLISTPPLRADDPKLDDKENKDNRENKSDSETKFDVSTFEGAVSRLKERFPDPFRLLRSYGDVARELLDLAAARPGTADADRARLAAAALLENTGDERQARDIRKRVLLEAKDPKLRARAAYAAGLPYFLRESYKQADSYWKLVPRIAPDSSLAAAVGRFQPYLDLVASRRLPDVEVEFTSAKGSERRRLSAPGGAGVLLQVWSSADPGGAEASRDVRDLLQRTRKPGTPGPVLLGLNLDASEKAFAQALTDWKIDWPQHHDGQGFEGPVARALAVPRLPHWILARADGSVVYVGSRLTGRKSLEEAITPGPSKAAADPAPGTESEPGAGTGKE